MPGFYRQPLWMELTQEVGADLGNHHMQRALIIAEILALPDVGC